MRLLLSIGLTATLASLAAAAGTVNVYWGQNGATRLSEVCQRPGIGYVTLSFVTHTPEHAGGWPGTNFGWFHCDPGYFDKDGVPTKLQNGCHLVAEDIPKCQAKGIKVILSVGGVYDPELANYALSTPARGVEFATQLWHMFGPAPTNASARRFPRPFGNATVDGVDLDIEIKFDDQTPWIAFIKTLRSLVSPSGHRFLITGAPQCPLADRWFQMKQMISNAQFDILFIQFYNNDGCDYVNGIFNYDDWTQFLIGTKSEGATLFVGLPAYETKAWVKPCKLGELVSEYGQRADWGGIMLWDEYWAEQSDYLPSVVLAVESGGKGVEACPPDDSACAQTYRVVERDTCWKISQEFGLTVSELMALNPTIDADCGNLAIQQVLCVKAKVGGSSTSTTPTSTATTTNPPASTTTGGGDGDGSCAQTYTVVSGDYCYKIAERFGITVATLMALNPAIDERCENLGIGQVLCVKAGGAGPTTASSSSLTTTSKSTTTRYLNTTATAPTSSLTSTRTTTLSATTATSTAPTSTAGAGGCTEYHTVVQGDSCWAISQQYGLEFDQFLALNPQLGGECDIWPGNRLCVGGEPPRRRPAGPTQAPSTF